MTQSQDYYNVVLRLLVLLSKVISVPSMILLQELKMQGHVYLDKKF